MRLRHSSSSIASGLDERGGVASPCSGSTAGLNRAGSAAAAARESETSDVCNDGRTGGGGRGGKGASGMTVGDATLATGGCGLGAGGLAGIAARMRSRRRGNIGFSGTWGFAVMGEGESLGGVAASFEELATAPPWVKGKAVGLEVESLLGLLTLLTLRGMAEGGSLGDARCWDAREILRMLLIALRSTVLMGCDAGVAGVDTEDDDDDDGRAAEPVKYPTPRGAVLVDLQGNVLW